MEYNNMVLTMLEEAFKKAYMQGNKDGSDGVFVNPAVLFEQYLMSNEIESKSEPVKKVQKSP